MSSCKNAWVHQPSDPWKKASSTVVSIDANQSESHRAWLRTFCTAVYLAKGKCRVVVLWLESWTVELEHLPYLLLVYFLDCEPGHMRQACVVCPWPCGVRSLWLQCPGSFAYRDSMEAQAYFKAGNFPVSVDVQANKFSFSKLHGDS